MKKIRITFELPAEVLKRLADYALKHTDGNVSAAVRRILREVLR
jgi:hypothetical protein